MRTSIVAMFAMVIILVPRQQTLAQVSVPGMTESFQLQQLINKSEQQLQSLKAILNYEKQDAASLEKASKILEKLSNGIDKSIEKYHGTEIYEKALLQLQSKDDFKKTYSDSKQVKDQVLNSKNAAVQSSVNGDFEDLVQFQKDSVRANQSDLSNQRQLQEALQSAQSGFVPKIQAQAQLGNWQASTRLSAQLTELLAAIHAMREELRVMRLNEDHTNPLGVLIKGAEVQNEKLREANKR